MLDRGSPRAVRHRTIWRGGFRLGWCAWVNRAEVAAPVQATTLTFGYRCDYRGKFGKINSRPRSGVNARTERGGCATLLEKAGKITRWVCQDGTSRGPCRAGAAHATAPIRLLRLPCDARPACARGDPATACAGGSISA